MFCRFHSGLAGLRPRAILALLVIASGSLSMPARGDETRVEGEKTASTGLLEQRLRTELRVILLDMVQAGELSAADGRTGSLLVESPTERVSDLGVLVDTRSGDLARNGLRVLGTTPGGLASRLGFRNGDFLVSINDVVLANLGDDSDGSSRAGRVLRSTLASMTDGSPLVFGVVRNGEAVTLGGVKRSVLVPAFTLRVGSDYSTPAGSLVEASSANGASGCGWISTFDNAPRQKQLHAAVLISIDDLHSPLLKRTNYRVSAGRHILRIGELIENRYLGFSEKFRDRGGLDRYKTLSVDVEPNMTYSLAAHLIPEHRNEWRDGKFWEPVIWNTTQENCR